MSGLLPEDRLQIDLASEELGGRAIYANDEFFGPAARLLLPGAPEWREGEYTDEGKWMDGWETRRRREPGHDWCIVELGQVGEIEEALIDTAFFKGNYPDRCSLQAALIDGASADSIIAQSESWPQLLPPQKLEMNREHVFRDAIEKIGPVNHLRINIFPDGGLSRVRLYGKIHD